MHLLKTLLLCTLVFLISNNLVAQQKDTVVKKESAGSFKHMKVPGYVLPDADKDGVTDQFDKEPNTVKGCPVDAHGVSLDTDGDGVIDCKDKEPLTQRDCFPVNDSGKGLCPEPDCCHFVFSDAIKNPLCKIEGLYGQEFNIIDTIFSLVEIQLLDNYVNKLNQNSNCGLIIQAYAKNNSERKAQSIIQYLIKTKGIAEDRLVLNVSSGPNVKIIDFIPINLDE